MSFIAKHNDMVKNAPSPTSTTLLLHRIVIACLMVIIILQYSVIHNAHVEDPNPIAPPNAEASDKATAPQARIDDTNATLICATAAPPRPLPAPHKAYEGVAVTTFLGAPKWFQNRYTLMVNQVLAMIEDDWIVQIFYDPAVKMAREGIAYPGIQRQILRGRVLLTPLPSSMKKIKKNNLLLSSWFWSNIVAENVLLFGGTAALCANTNLEVSNFTGRYDYIGTPWGQFNGQGGEGGISLRNRTVMQGIVQRYEREMQEQGRAMGAAKEDSVIVRSLLEQKGRLATKEDTILFAMSDRTAQGSPLAVSGTLGGLSDQARQEYLDYCPEMKMMFPSLHNAACFGAEPNALECFKYLCITSRLRCGEKFTDISFTNAKNRKVSIHISLE